MDLIREMLLTPRLFQNIREGSRGEGSRPCTGQDGRVRTRQELVERGAVLLRVALGRHVGPHPTLYTLHPTPYTLHPTPYTLHPAPGPARKRESATVGEREREREGVGFTGVPRS